jgi:hypothetical protein
MYIDRFFHRSAFLFQRRVAPIEAALTKMPKLLQTYAQNVINMTTSGRSFAVEVQPL